MIELEVDNRAPSCPKCESTMAFRTLRKEIHAGQNFWGCSHYPKCKEVVSLSRAFRLTNIEKMSEVISSAMGMVQQACDAEDNKMEILYNLDVLLKNIDQYAEDPDMFNMKLNSILY